MRQVKLLRESGGFTLIEMIMVMVIIGIVASTSAFFVQRVFLGFNASRERMLLAEQARVALSRFKRETRLSLPNSIRVSNVGALVYMEFVPVVTAGRYRAGSATGSDPVPACSPDTSLLADNSVLTIGSSDSCFKSIGLFDINGAGAGDWLVVFNAGAGYAGADVYESGSSSGGNKSSITGFSASLVDVKVDFAANVFQWDSPGHRFYVARNPVTYVCDPASGSLYRVSGYAVQSSQPTGGIMSLPGSVRSFLLKNVNSCSLSYVASTVGGQIGLATMNVKLLSSSGDPVVLQTQTLVENRP